MGAFQKERMIPMLKKLASLLLSLLLCLSLLPDQVCASDAPKSGLPVQTEASEADRPNVPVNLIMLIVEDYPAVGETDCSGD